MGNLRHISAVSEAINISVINAHPKLENSNYANSVVINYYPKGKARKTVSGKHIPDIISICCIITTLN